MCARAVIWKKAWMVFTRCGIRIRTDSTKALALPAVQERLERVGVETGSMTVDAFQQLLKADYESAGVLVKASGARIE